MAQNRTVLNANTTHLMLLGTDNLTRSAGDTHVTMPNTVITKTNTENLLGCYWSEYKMKNAYQGGFIQTLGNIRISQSA